MNGMIIALYIRLSLEDAKYDSMSIPNQQMILREKALLLTEYADAEIREFIDNGHTGTNFERPAMQELLTMVQSGRVGCILVKDFSRFGRNSIETGYFLERVFPLYHTRFISVSDGFDSDEHKGDTGGIDVAFKYLINEAYSRDMSIKSKSAKYAKMKRGEYLSSMCPYGYRKSKDGRLEVDEETAPIVKQIFSWAADGYGATEISRKLYAQGVMTPGEYRALHGKHPYDLSRTAGIWPNTTVLRLLQEEQYTGTYIMGRREVTEIGGKRSRPKDRKDWFIVPDHHPPLVSKELFEQANAKLRRGPAPKRKDHDYPLKGMIFCGYCNHAMRRANNRRYVCGYMKGYNNLGCSGLSVGINDVEQTVSRMVQAHIKAITGHDIQTEKIQFHTMQREQMEQDLRSLQQQKRELYESFVSGALSKEKYLVDNASVEYRIIKTKTAISAAEEAEKAVLKQKAAKEELDALAKEIESAESITHGIAERIIRKVLIFHDQRIEVEFTVQDFFSGGGDSA